MKTGVRFRGFRYTAPVTLDVDFNTAQFTSHPEDRQAHMATMEISEQELVQFEAAVAIACTRKSETRLERQRPAKFDPAAQEVPSWFSGPEGSLVISFDRSWYPYLCNSGVDEAAPARWYIPKVSRLIAAIAGALQTPMQRAVSYVPGSRIFLDSAGGRRRPEGKGEIAVIGWNLPRKSRLLPPR